MQRVGIRGEAGVRPSESARTARSFSDVAVAGWLAAWCGTAAGSWCVAANVELAVDDATGAAGRVEAPVCCAVEPGPARFPNAAATHFTLQETRDGIPRGPLLPAQFESGVDEKWSGRWWWLMPAGSAMRRTFVLSESAAAPDPVMRVKRDSVSGQIEIREGDRPVLRYNYQTIEPGDLAVRPDNRKYARARSDYIHPLYGLDGEELTKDWPVDHPHHRGIYWAWPEVDYRGERGDLHALQRVFARPTGRWVGQDGPVFAQIDAENLWRWDDQRAIVRERARIRAYRLGAHGRCVDLDLEFTALDDDVAIARRGTDHYGGLNIRLASVHDQRIGFHTDPGTANPRMAWGDLTGAFGNGQARTRLTVFQARTNPAYPGDWIQYPELNWFQPTFPAAGTRWILKKNQPLRLRFRLWIHRPDDATNGPESDQWRVYTLTFR